MLGLMQDWPLLCHRIIDHAALNYGERPVISRSIEGPIHTTNYVEVRARALRVAQRLERDGIRPGDRVATLAWNTWRHLEAWYGIMGAGGVYHTVNPRLFPEQISWIVNHAEDRVMMVDLTFLPILEKLADGLKPIERYVVLTDAAHMPATASEKCGAVRGLDRRSRRRFRLEDVRRKYRRRHVLHVGYDRPSERRGLFASLQRAALDDGGAARRDGRLLARRDPAGGADVPRQLLGSGADLADGRRGDGDARGEARRRLDLRAARYLSRQLHGRGADRLADAAGAPGKQQSEAAVFAKSGDRRLGLSARHDPEIPRRLRRRGLPCLGHDRDEFRSARSAR